MTLNFPLCGNQLNLIGRSQFVQDLTYNVEQLY